VEIKIGVRFKDIGRIKVSEFKAEINVGIDFGLGLVL
jgi:hypothetical protein